jgi:hypothetical protein
MGYTAWSPGVIEAICALAGSLVLSLSACGRLEHSEPRPSDPAHPLADAGKGDDAALEAGGVDDDAALSPTENPLAVLDAGVRCDADHALFPLFAAWGKYDTDPGGDTRLVGGQLFRATDADKDGTATSAGEVQEYPIAYDFAELGLVGMAVDERAGLWLLGSTHLWRFDARDPTAPGVAFWACEKECVAGPSLSPKGSVLIVSQGETTQRVLAVDATSRASLEGPFAARLLWRGSLSTERYELGAVRSIAAAGEGHFFLGLYAEAIHFFDGNELAEVYRSAALEPRPSHPIPVTAAYMQYRPGHGLLVMDESAYGDISLLADRDGSGLFDSEADVSLLYMGGTVNGPVLAGLWFGGQTYAGLDRNGAAFRRAPTFDSEASAQADEILFAAPNGVERRARGFAGVTGACEGSAAPGEPPLEPRCPAELPCCPAELPEDGGMCQYPDTLCSYSCIGGDRPEARCDASSPLSAVAGYWDVSLRTSADCSR